MRSSEARSTAVAFAVLGISVLAIATIRPGLAQRFHGLSTRTDVYALPAPEQTIVASLGWRSAVADLIFAHVLVSYGLHFQERRRFEFVGNYLDTINALDPKFRAPYAYADTLLTLGPEAPRWQDHEKAREILERGMRERPDDGALWSTAGQFMAYLAPARTQDPKVKEEWRLAGARRLARACELVGSNDNLPYHCITAATIFSKAGEREATRRFLERVLAVTDDEQIRQMALSYLERTLGEEQRAEVARRVQAFRAAWEKDLVFVSKDSLLIVGPDFDPAQCSGRIDGEACATSWRDWGEQSPGRR